MERGDKRGRARSFLIGGLVGASAALATARRRRSTLMGPGEEGVETPAGLAAFEGAPCFEELVGQAQAEKRGD